MTPEERYFWQAIAEAIGKECPQIYSHIMDAIEDEGCSALSLKTIVGMAYLRWYGMNGDCIREEIFLPEFVQKLYEEQKGKEISDGVPENPVSI